MKIKAASGIMLTLLLISMLTIAFNIQPVKAVPTTIIVPDDYEKIRWAIGNASDGDTVFVRAGTYYEHVVVNKSVSLIGDNRQNTIIDGNFTGTVIQVTASNVNVTGFTIQNGGKYPYRGIFVSSSGNNISYNNIRNNKWKGVEFKSSSSNTFSGNNITNNYAFGIYLYSSSNNSIYGNNIIANGITGNAYTGFVLTGSSNNSIYGNNITNNAFGISFWSSSNNTLRDNNIANNDYNFEVWGESLSDFVNNIDTSNTVDGKPIYYWISKRDMIVPPNAGHVTLVNCTGITVQNLNLTNNESGVLLAYTTNSTVTKNSMTNNRYSIYLYMSSNNSISGNSITNNNFRFFPEGILLELSSNNNISGNNVTNNHVGIYLEYSSNNTLSGNNLTNNEYGIWVSESSNNRIHHNNFISNTVQVYDPSWNHAIWPPHSPSFNVWDDGYPSGGNDWSDYTGVDLYSGPYQNWTGSDGIGDTPYVIDANNRDNYPLMITTSLLPPYGPTAKFSYLPYAPLANKTLTFYASDSMPGWNGTHFVPIANYTWDFGDGNISTTPNSVITHIYAAGGTYTVNLTVTCQDDPVLIALNLTSNSTWRNITIQPDPKFTETTVYLNPATITATEAGQNFTVEVRIADVIDLFAFVAGMTYDPNALELVDFKAGPFLTAGGVKGEDYLTIQGTIDNIAGEIYRPYFIGLTGIGSEKGIWGTGSGTLFIANFTAKKAGIFNVHPAELGLWDSKLVKIPANVRDVFTVVQEENVYPIVVVSSLAGSSFDPPRIRIYNYGFNQTTKAISFNITGEPGQTGFCNVTIPNDLLKDTPQENWAVIIDSSEVPSIIDHNATHTFIYFTYMLSTHNIVIKVLSSPPTADFSFSPRVSVINETVTFDASASLPGWNGTADVPIVSYEWDFGDGSYGEGKIVNHTYTTTGTYTVTLNVTDIEGLWDIAEAIVEAGIRHDVAVVSVAVAFPWGAGEATGIYPGWKINVTVAVRNEGDFTENFNVTIFYNKTSTEWVKIGSLNVTDLAAGNETTLTFVWDTTGVPLSVVNHTYTVYVIKAEASAVPDEVDVIDNVRTGGKVWVKLIGDVNGDGAVKGFDAALFAAAWWSAYGDPNYDPRCDFNGDGEVKGFDAALFCSGWWIGKI